MNTSINHILKPCLYASEDYPEAPPAEGLYFQFLETEKVFNMYNQVKERAENAYKCANRINDYINEKFS